MITWLNLINAEAMNQRFPAVKFTNELHVRLRSRINECTSLVFVYVSRDDVQRRKITDTLYRGYKVCKRRNAQIGRRELVSY